MILNRRLLLELSGEHPKLPIAELQTVLNSILSEPAKNDKILKKLTDRLVIIDFENYSTDLIHQLSTRLSMCRTITELLDVYNAGSNEKLVKMLSSIKLPQKATFKVSARHFNKNYKWSKNDSRNIKNKIIKELLTFARADVKHPDIEIILFFGPEIYIAKKLIEINRRAFDSRRAHNRPFFAPISLHPRLARCLINLAELHESDVVLDPFCGTGGLLIEAGLMGFTIIGSDIDSRMVSGTKINLDHCGIKDYSLYNMDIANLTELFSDTDSRHNQYSPPQAIVTEPPYGRASTTKGEALDSLLIRAFRIFNQILPPNGHVVISLPDPKLPSETFQKFKLKYKFTIRIHKSLTKTIFVLINNKNQKRS